MHRRSAAAPITRDGKDPACRRRSGGSGGRVGGSSGGAGGGGGEASASAATSSVEGGDAARHAALASLLLLLLGAPGARADKNRYFHMQSLCKTHFLQQLYRKIDGAVLQSQNERNLDCVVTFQTHSILQRFMLRFDLLQLDCNDHLFVYDGAHAVGSYKSDLSCRNTKHSVGIIYTRTNFVTLKYVTDSWGTESNGFKLVITAFKGKSVAEHACEDFRCERDYCIATDLVCDDVNHCGDGSDEAGVLATCAQNNMNTVLGMSLTVFVVSVVSGLLVVFACVVGVAVCLCRRGTNGRALPSAQQPPPAAGSFPLQQMYGWNGAGSGGASALLKAAPPPYPGPPPAGNYRHPAGPPLGYSAARVRLYCQAK